MALPLRKEDRGYTYGDYRAWPAGERWELIDGVAWNMSPAANRRHQEVVTELLFQIREFLEDKPCRVYPAPFDVLLPDFAGQEEDLIPTVVQPDISVVCDESKLTTQGCTGAPDWIIEILSPSTAHKDFSTKFSLYEKHGVKEYWILDPGNRYVHVYLLGEDGRYAGDPIIYLAEDAAPSTTLPGLTVKLPLVFSRD